MVTELFNVGFVLELSDYILLFSYINGSKEKVYDFLVVKTFACFSAGAEFSSGPIAEPVVRWTLGSSW